MAAVLVDLMYASAYVAVHCCVSFQYLMLMVVEVVVVQVLCVAIAMAVEVQSRLPVVQVLEIDSPSQ